MKFHALALLAAIAPFAAGAPAAEAEAAGALEARAAPEYKAKLYKGKSCKGKEQATISGGISQCKQIDPSEALDLEDLDKACSMYLYQSLNACVIDNFDDGWILQLFGASSSKGCHEPYTPVGAYKVFCGGS